MGRIRKLWFIVLAAILVGIYGAVNLSDAVDEWTAPPFHCPPPSAFETCVILRTRSGPSTWLSFSVGVAGLTAAACLLVLFRRLDRRRTAGPTEAN